MIVSYHCRSCNEKGQKEISIDLLTKKKEELNKHVLNTIILLIGHECKDGNKKPSIGIKLSGDK